MKVNIPKRICPYSGIEFTPKRSNQIFANKEWRSAFNNRKHNKKRKQLAFINKPLLKNYNIISQILGSQTERVVHKEYLRGAGFSFSVFTNLHKDQNSNKYYYSVYHFYYYKINNEHYKIVNYG